MRQETEVHFLVGTVMLGFHSIFKKSQASSPFEALNSVCSWVVKGMWFPLSRWGGDLRLYQGSSEGIQTSLHLVRWKTILNLSHCREIRPSFESGPLTDHSTWDRKHRVLLTYLSLNENSSWGACRKLTHYLSQRQRISSHLETVWCARRFPRGDVLKLIFV